MISRHILTTAERVETTELLLGGARRPNDRRAIEHLLASHVALETDVADAWKLFGVVTASGGNLAELVSHERTLRLAAEGREAVLRTALAKVRTLTGCYECMLAERDICNRCADIHATVDDALASSSSTAGAVLATADDWLDDGTSDSDLADIIRAWRDARAV